MNASSSLALDDVVFDLVLQKQKLAQRYVWQVPTFRTLELRTIRSCAARHTFQRRPKYSKCKGGSRSLTHQRAAKAA
jgi:hypothetical protein